MVRAAPSSASVAATTVVPSDSGRSLLLRIPEGEVGRRIVFDPVQLVLDSDEVEAEFAP